MNLADIPVDAQKLINDLSAEIAQKTVDVAVLRAQLSSVMEINRGLTEALEKISNSNQEGEASEEVHEVPAGPGAGFGVHAGSIAVDGDRAGDGGDESSDPDAQ